tara:strand:- start:518 stop:1048 length:531 start_codon:yes stop_codon:yes gene_type:complete
MKIFTTKFIGLKVIKSKVHKDSRGYFKETFKKKFFKKEKFIFGCASHSKKNVLRGMHIQKKFSQGKYVTVLKGEILDVVVDLRKNSKTFGKHYKIILSSDNGKSIYIPPGFAHGFLGKKDNNIIFYYCTNYRSSKNELGLKWNDKKLNIKWSIKKPILSIKDKKNISFADYLKSHA